MRWLLAPLRLPVYVAQRFHSERLAQTAAALSFTTLLGLVPMIVVGAALMSHLPFGQDMGVALQKFLFANLLPEKSGGVIARHLGTFANRAERITAVGLGFLGVTALMQMLTIEHAFNAIWKVKAARPWLRRLAMHLLTLLIGPLVFGASLAATTFLASVSLGFVEGTDWLLEAFFRATPFVVTAILFALLYWGVPNKAIARRHAIIGGLFAASAFALMQRLFSLYIANFPAYTVMYGAFAALPIFLAWLYFSWSVVLIGAVMVAEMPRATR